MILIPTVFVRFVGLSTPVPTTISPLTERNLKNTPPLQRLSSLAILTPTAALQKIHLLTELRQPMSHLKAAFLPANSGLSLVEMEGAHRGNETTSLLAA